uniref:Bifunctional purine biosynthesis protein PurH n=1 Tax=Cyanothece sp. (strain PCC 7425 / ATCC 29141) TaxID=395961 RepID=PUR9_CYAP4|nr:RecName: Full=Bifunctional purine biosynthesis protein PurH; Includes: RecName: Full=Phosphoribosylaminoimidazolecarboxamide formyltransferase; AltName: Full=AICAR transformylase; Includes: RecName: Full=IMP cyclohydrolase; AltName: Full=ATIC; AltName: Full=IMP synthase; AltName: Full=Inosinicase [Cyanothece sp. PCC 7425]
MPPLALLSTSDKTGVVEFARSLVNEFGFQLISSGGTAKALIAAGLPVTKVADYTGSPEILGGRVKTLHPRIHGGILARRDLPTDLQDLAATGIEPIDLVVVNLYPFEQTIAQPDMTLSDAIEQIDIGGPALLRASAKNFAHVTVLCSPEQYGPCLAELRQQQGQTSLIFRQSCAQKAFWHTATYDQAIATYLTSSDPTEISLPPRLSVTATQFQSLRYGENPHQAAAWYRTGTATGGWSGATQLQGKELSYNNLVDLEAARAIVAEFTEQPAAVITKHTNPCGVAEGDSLVEAYRRAFQADSTSAFGGIVALNHPLDGETAKAMTETFLECIVAPGCEPEAEAILKTKSNLRVLVLPDLSQGASLEIKAIAGGFLVQQPDRQPIQPQSWEVVSQTKPTEEQWQELIFAWKVAKHVKSNAIVVTADRVTLGVGAGQMNRVGSVQIALTQAGEKAQGAVLASDGFFPFDDSVRAAAAAGIGAIVQPGGSKRDADSIQAADQLGLVMVFTHTRHFLH